MLISIHVYWHMEEKTLKYEASSTATILVVQFDVLALRSLEA